MAQAHSKQAAHSHMHDFEGHVEAVEADLKYWRAKRLEPRLIQLHRRGLLTFYDLVRTATAHPAAPTTAVAIGFRGITRFVQLSRCIQNRKDRPKAVFLMSFDHLGDQRYG
jgi:hypothetical protein